jgi:hypothetical protein
MAVSVFPGCDEVLGIDRDKMYLLTDGIKWEYIGECLGYVGKSNLGIQSEQVFPRIWSYKDQYIYYGWDRLCTIDKKRRNSVFTEYVEGVRLWHVGIGEKGPVWIERESIYSEEMDNDDVEGNVDEETVRSWQILCKYADMSANRIVIDGEDGPTMLWPMDGWLMYWDPNMGSFMYAEY